MKKRYGCIFTCLQMRAVHIEVSYSLSTDSFNMTLLSFMSRRGAPSEIFSDNGTNFVGAQRELKNLMENWSSDKIADRLLQRGVQWHFNPPHASHRGGIWEIMVRSVRRVLLSVCDEQPMTDEILLTFLTESERIVNGRPLVPLTSDCRDLPVLTPNDLLILRANPRDIPTDSLRDRMVRQWRQANYLASVFWKRWIREYLPLLQQRQKWITRERNLD